MLAWGWPEGRTDLFPEYIQWCVEHGTGCQRCLLANGVDPHYALLALPVGCSAANANCQEGPGDAFGPNAYVVTGSDPVGTLWAAHSAGSKWIGPRADQSTGEIYGNDTDFYL